MQTTDDNTTFIEFGTINKFQIYKIPIPQVDAKAIYFWIVVPKGVSPKFKPVHHILSSALQEHNL